MWNSNPVNCILCSSRSLWYTCRGSLSTNPQAGAQTVRPHTLYYNVFRLKNGWTECLFSFFLSQEVTQSTFKAGRGNSDTLASWLYRVWLYVYSLVWSAENQCICLFCRGQNLNPEHLTVSLTLNVHIVSHTPLNLSCWSTIVTEFVFF